MLSKMFLCLLSGNTNASFPLNKLFGAFGSTFASEHLRTEKGGKGSTEVGLECPSQPNNKSVALLMSRRTTPEAKS